MGMVSRGSRVVVLALVATAAVVIPAAAAAGRSAPAGTSGAVGPQEYFTGVINGTDGNTANPITIKMVCPSTKAGAKGHPKSGQTLAVHQLFPPASSVGSLGYSGNDSEIGVFFTTPPPVAAGGRSSAAASPVFTRYDKTKKLSTALSLPCSGTGTVYFAPIAVVPPAVSATVPVKYVS